MVKIFVTGDNHIGKKYDRYPDIKDKLIKSRIDSMRDMVRKAEEEGCGVFVVTGDLFDNVNTIKVSDVKQVVEILSEFTGNVLVLPGNHDYYTGDEKVWIDFEKALSNMDHNITLLNEFKEYTFDIGDEKVVVYPAFCQSKHSQENNLSWIKEADINTNGDCYNIGIAHGAISGLTPDLKNEYFLMNESELTDIPVDAWLVGHTHIQYPSLKCDEDMEGFKVFNAGTHEQTDLSNNTEGVCFIITLDNSSGKTRVFAHKYISGRVRFYDLKIDIKASDSEALGKALKELITNIAENSIVRVKISGTVSKTEYENRGNIYQSMLGRFMSYECNDKELGEEITVDKIRSEFSELSFAAQLMEKLIDNPRQLQMAYELLQNCKES